MTRLNISVSDELKAQLEFRARESGFDRVESYVESLLQRETQDVIEDEDLEQLLLKRMDETDAVELTDDFVAGFDRQIENLRTRKD